MVKICLRSFENYSLVPKQSLPAALNDCLTATSELFRIVLASDSAGGRLASAVTQSLLRDGFIPHAVCLQYPALQLFYFTLPSCREYLHRNIFGIIDEDNFISAIFQLSGRRGKVTPDFLFNNHISVRDKRRLRPFLDADLYLTTSSLFDTDQECNESHFLKCLHYLFLMINR